MKKLIVPGVSLVLLIGLVIGWGSIREVGAQIIEYFYTDPDMGPFETAKSGISKEEFMLRRSEGIALKRGLEEGKPVDPRLRIDAIRQMEQQQEDLASSLAPQAAHWTEIGPNPIPNAQVETPPVTTASGRVVTIAVHPTNPDIVYVGTAQGGLYRSTNGGTHWTRMMDSALSLAIGAIAIAPSQPDTIYVGTGEANFSADSFFGVGVYRIDNASTVLPILIGPLNGVGAIDVFTGRAIGEIVIHPTDPATIFVASTSGIGGIVGASSALPSRGLYRSTDATSADPTFTKLTVAAAGENLNMVDLAMDPANANRLLVSVIGSSTQSGVWLSTDALGPATFTRQLLIAGTTSATARTELAINNVGGVVTAFAASADGGGKVFRSTDGGTTWTERIDNNFCTPQCFYDIAIAAHPTIAGNVYLGGSAALVFGRSTDGGATFTADGASFTAGLHVDTHALAVAPSNPLIVYLGTDGGIYRTSDVTATPIVWTSLNNSQFTATQFMSIAVHPIDPNFSIGGTQDNGTIFYRPDATWFRADFGDGGYSVIDQSATGTTTVNMYHTYFNDAATLQGYAFLTNGLTPTEGSWVRRGCASSGSTVNGITCNGVIRFYAPLEQGPGTPNTIYYGSDRLYRSDDTGITHTVVSQNPIVAGVPLTAIGISPQNDNVRIAGLLNGSLWGTTTGSATLTDLDTSNAIPDRAIARIVIDPQNADIAYITLSAFGVTNIWKTGNLSGVAPTWTASASGLPQVPVNAFIVDPATSSILYAGTDIGVFVSTNSGAIWTPFGTGLPRVAVFDMAKTPGNLIRIATHGRGMWQIPSVDTVSIPVSVSGRVLTPSGLGLRNAVVTKTDSGGVRRIATTSSFGFYNLADVASSQSYFIGVSSKRYRFATRQVNVNGNLSAVDFVGLE